MGYRFENAHIKLGSKIHLKDFFYAERMFQNSYYALRFAYLIAKYIAHKESNWKDKLDSKNKNYITILGYGLYSELLISNVVKFLNIKFDNNQYKFNHCVIEDIEGLKLLDKEDLKQSIILILPIGSTLTTQIKIYNSIKNSGKFILKPITVIVVGHKEINEITNINGEIKQNTIVKQFWDRIDIENKYIFLNKNIIPDEDDNNGNINKTHYFIYLPSEWYCPCLCPKCYPEDCYEEKALFETNKVSVTPQTIFSLPIGKKEDNNLCPIVFEDKAKKNIAVITFSMVNYGHYERGMNHYLFYVDTNEFFKKNENAIKNWLKKLKAKDFKNDGNNILNSRIILIAPAHNTNIDFVNLVNEDLFERTAIVIHYDPKEDYRQNFGVFFKTDSDRENTYFFFVDDALCTGITLRIVDSLLKSLNLGGINVCITMINRLSDKRNEILKEELGQEVYSFTNLEAPVIRDIEKPCHLCEEKKKYKKILNRSLIDVLRWETKYKEIKLEVKNISEENEDGGRNCIMDQGNSERYLQRLKTVHMLYSEFRENDNLKKFFKEDVSYSLEDLLRILPTEFKYNKEYKFHILKILSTPYFVYYKDIHKKIFEILLSELKNVLERKDILDIPYGIILIKRLAYLNSTSLIRKEVLSKIRNWIEDEEIGKSYKEIKDLETKKSELKEKIQGDKNFEQATEIINLIIQNLQTKNEKMWKEILDILAISITKNSEIEGGLPFSTSLTQEECQMKINEYSHELYGEINNLLEDFETNYPKFARFIKDKKNKLTLQNLDEIVKSIEKFNVIYAQAVKEIIYKDEAKSLRLECELDKIDKSHKSEDDETPFKDLLNFLRIENVTIVQNALKYFLDKIYNSNNKIKLSGDIEKNLQELEENMNIEKEIESNYRLLYLRYLINYFSGKNLENVTDEIENLEKSNFYKEQFLPTLFLTLFLQEKIKDKFNNIERRINYILELLCKIVDIKEGNGGAFLAINRKIGKEQEIEPYIIGAVGKGKEKLGDIDFQNSWTSKVFRRIESGNLWKGRPWTNIKRYKGDKNNKKLKEWIEFDDLPEKKVLNNVKYFLFLRITKVEVEENKPKLKPQGVIVFYNENKENLEKDYRYLLVLRNDLNKFLEKHYENHSFEEWIFEHNLSETRREIAHDLKTPLTRLKEILRSPEKSKENINIINRTIKDIDDILCLINLGIKRQTVTKIWLFSFLKILEEIHEEGIQFKIIVPENVYIMGDGGYLKRVFNNIIQNAKEAKATKIKIELKNERLLIQNNGEKISSDIGRKIFGKEFSTKANGSGLGLHIVQEILSFYNAKIELFNTDPVIFSIYFKELYYEEDN